jgi:acetyltransferase-like isoleucine patch superfamily enzyme
MIIYRIHDYISVFFYRLIRFWFGSFGKRVRIVRPRYIGAARRVFLGDDVALQEGAYVVVEPRHSSNARLEIGAGTKIGNWAHIVVTHSVVFEESVLLADRVYVGDNAHEYRDPRVPVIDQGLVALAPVRIGKGSWIGDNACIVGASIGEHCVIGANSVVTRDIPAFSVAVGCPAIPIKRFCFDSQAWRATAPDGSFLPTDSKMESD